MQDNWVKQLGGQSPYAEALKLMGQRGDIANNSMTWLKGPLPMAQKPQTPQLQTPKSLGQGENVAPWIHDQKAKEMMMAQEAMRGGAGMPSTMENYGKYGGFEDNYFPEARMNMHLAPRQSSIQGALPNMGVAQGNLDNYFPEARMNSPFGRSPAMAKMGAAPKAQNIAILKRSETVSPGIRADGSRIDYSKKAPVAPMNNKKVKDLKR